jgi:hypothetical protein
MKRPAHTPSPSQFSSPFDLPCGIHPSHPALLSHHKRFAPGQGSVPEHPLGDLTHVQCASPSSDSPPTSPSPSSGSSVLPPSSATTASQSSGSSVLPPSSATAATNASQSSGSSVLPPSSATAATNASQSSASSVLPPSSATSLSSHSSNWSVGRPLRQSECLRRIHECYHILTATCAACYALSRPMLSDHTVDDCPHPQANHQDAEWIAFRSSVKVKRACFGCWVPARVRIRDLSPAIFPNSYYLQQVFFSDTANRQTKLLHLSPMGYACTHNETVRQLVYVVLHDPHLRSLFAQSPFNTLGLDTPRQLDLAKWLDDESKTAPPLSNLLTVVDFIIQLRGMPVPCPTLSQQ